MNPIHILGVLLVSAFAQADSEFYKFSALDIHGRNVSMEKYRGHVSVVVNVASLWGLADTNYRQLQNMFERFGQSKGLRILAFPCNQFHNQEPGTNEEIYKWATEKYNVTFDMFSKIDVNGPTAHPLYKYLQNILPGFLWNSIKWNYTKFLLDKDGKPIKRYAPTDEPFSMLDDIQKLW